MFLIRFQLSTTIYATTTFIHRPNHWQSPQSLTAVRFSKCGHPRSLLISDASLGCPSINFQFCVVFFCSWAANEIPASQLECHPYITDMLSISFPTVVSFTHPCFFCSFPYFLICHMFLIIFSFFFQFPLRICSNGQKFSL